MREIKFRAWDKEVKEMLYDQFVFEMRSLGYYEDEQNHKSCSQKCNSPCKKDNRFFGYISDCPAWVMMQYTGLRDKNGKEGCDSDITKSDDTKYCHGINLWQIMWNDSYACWQMKHIKGNHPMPSIPLHSLLDMEVIGNIYENEELVNGK